MAASYQLPPVMFYILDKFIKCRVVTKISSCGVNTTSRQGIKQQGISFGSIFLLFSNKSSWGPQSQQPGEIPGPRLLMTALKCFSKLVKVVRSVFKLVGFKLHALLVQPKHIITDYSRLPPKSYEPLLLLVYIIFQPVGVLWVSSHRND